MALRPVSLDSSVSAVSLHDPAFDLVGKTEIGEDGKPQPMGLAYVHKRAKNPAIWREVLTPKDGASPTEFVLGVIPAAELNRAEDECGLGTMRFKSRELYWRCFLLGVRAIAGWPSKVPTKYRGDVEFVDPEWLAATFAGKLREDALDIGMQAWQWNQVAGDEVKN